VKLQGWCHPLETQISSYSSYQNFVWREVQAIGKESSMQCNKTKKDGKRCRAQALSGKKQCYLHSEPGKAAELGSKGGRSRSITKQVEPEPTITKPAEPEATTSSSSVVTAQTTDEPSVVAAPNTAEESVVAAPKTAEQVRDLLGQTMAQVKMGQAEIKTANAVAYVGTALLRAIEISTFEERIAALEVRRRERTGNEFG
jgi:hypothetical protein